MSRKEKIPTPLGSVSSRGCLNAHCDSPHLTAGHTGLVIVEIDQLETNPIAGCASFNSKFGKVHKETTIVFWKSHAFLGCR